VQDTIQNNRLKHKYYLSQLIPKCIFVYKNKLMYTLAAFGGESVQVFM